MDKHHIRQAFIHYKLEHGNMPNSVFAFCKILNIPEQEFYNTYNSLEAVSQDIWLGIFEDTKNQLMGDEVFMRYSSREKLLAFYFLWVQKLKENRSYVLLQKQHIGWGKWKDKELKLLKIAFTSFAKDLVRSAELTKEVKERKFISDKYAHGFWLQALFVLNYWIDDTSQNFENTDAAIEKAVNLSFQLISENSLDALVDFGKFILQKK
jgi:hypothetical protein